VGEYMSVFFLLLLVLFEEVNIVIKDPWIRPGAKGMNTAMYFEIINSGNEADTLYKAESKIADIVELHETYMKDDMMGMRKVDYVEIRARSSFKFKPGSNHIMFIDLKRKLKVGDKAEVTLLFKKEGKVKVKAVVRK
jgi:copper(I)-binding protein